jgi:hypothetical protein
MKLFIDDVRDPDNAGFKNDDWTVARDFYSAIKLIEDHKPQRIAFDHDLGDVHYAGVIDGTTGFDIAKFLVEADQNYPDAGYITEDFHYSSHSANPDGKRNIERLLYGYMNHKFRSGK